LSGWFSAHFTIAARVTSSARKPIRGEEGLVAFRFLAFAPSMPETSPSIVAPFDEAMPAEG
jgi:hypothetical protein